MIESSASLLPKSDRPLVAWIVGDSAPALDEMETLLRTLSIKTDRRFLFQTRRIAPATYIGKGKIEEIAAEIKDKASLIVFDFELTPKQLKNLEKSIGCPAVDRAGIIIEIFFQHARTKEAKTQVELAKLEYLLPRLAHYWTHFERQRGGIGLKGMGEKQLEVDRRLLRTRIQSLKSRLKDIEVERQVQRVGRQNISKVALVGYTNAGKSTLLNALTQSSVLAENKLFATLDASVRALDPDSHPPVVAIDTVGFISRIPPALVASFRSTLEELFEADLLVHVVDASSPFAREQYEVTEKILNELGLKEKPRMTVLNKMDLVQKQGPARLNIARLAVPGAFRLSAVNPAQVRDLRDKILEHFKQTLEAWEIMIPYSEPKLEAQMRSVGCVEKQNYLEKGTFFRVRIDPAWAKRLGLQRYRL